MGPLKPDATGLVILLVEDNRDIAEMVGEFRAGSCALKRSATRRC